jgi:hypothetical protein
MHPPVDIAHRFPPTNMLSTTGNTCRRPTARPLIKESIMKATTLHILILSSSLFTTACVGEVGGGSASRGRNAGSNDGSGSGSGACEEVTTAVTIRSASDFDELPKGCWDLFAPLTIQGSAITSVNKLGDLIGVDSIEIIGTGLTTIDTAKPLKVYGPVTISGNSTLRDTKNLVVERADNIPLGVTVEDNTALASLDGLVDITHLDSDLVVTGNQALSSVSLKRLKQIDGVVRVANNAALTTVDLSGATTIGKIELTNNTNLTTFAGLAATAIAGDLVIRTNPKLSSLGTMSALSRIEGSLTVDDNDALTTIGAFTTSMQAVTGSVTIANNQTLTSLGQISHFQGIGTASILNNPSLSICRAIEIEHCVGAVGTVTISNNADDDDCNCWCGR